MRDWVNIRSFRNSFEADLAQSVLESNGIECQILNTYAATMFAGAVEFEIWVHRSDADRAQNCLSQAGEQGTEGPESQTDEGTS